METGTSGQKSVYKNIGMFDSKSAISTFMCESYKQFYLTSVIIPIKTNSQNLKHFQQFGLFSISTLVTTQTSTYVRTTLIIVNVTQHTNANHLSLLYMFNVICDLVTPSGPGGWFCSAERTEI